jgi:hypothetical protein
MPITGGRRGAKRIRERRKKKNISKFYIFLASNLWIALKKSMGGFCEKKLCEMSTKVLKNSAANRAPLFSDLQNCTF